MTKTCLVVVANVFAGCKFKSSAAIRALGFAELRTVVQSSTPVVRLVALATVLPVFTTTMGQRVIRASESPRSVTVIGREEIDAVAAVSANQLLRQLPGLQELPAPPSKTSISIRGFDDSRVLVLIDGEPVPGALIESRDIGRLSTIATERIEVTKGPSSVEFGSDALGGVINIVQAAPTPRLTFDALAREGAHVVLVARGAPALEALVPGVVRRMGLDEAAFQAWLSLNGGLLHGAAGRKG